MSIGEASGGDRPPVATPKPAMATFSRRRIAKNFLALAGTGIVGLVITIVISIYARQILGPVAIGQVNWALAAIAILAVVVNPGLTTIGQREVARDPRRAQDFLGLLLTLQTIFAAVGYGVVVVIAALDVRGPVVHVLLLIQGWTLFLAAWNTGWMLQAAERMAAPAIAALIFNALQIPVLLLFIHGPSDVYLYAVLSLPFPLLGIVFNFHQLARCGIVSLARLRPRLTGAVDIFREAWPVALAQAAVLVQANSGTIVLGFTDGDEAVGQYSTAYRLMSVAAVIVAAMWNAFFPALARSHQSPDQATQLSREYSALFAWMGLPIAVLGWTFGSHVVELLYGTAFRAAGPYFEWLCLSVGLTFLNYGLTGTLLPWGHSTLQLKLAAAGAAINLVLNLAAIPAYGAWGAVFASIAAEATVLALGLLARRFYGIFWHPILPIVAPPLLCSAAVGLAIAALPVSLDRYWFVTLPTGAGVLVGCLLLLQGKTVRQAIESWRRNRA